MAIGLNIKGLVDTAAKITEINNEANKPIARTQSDFKSRGPGYVHQSVSEVYNIKKSEVKKDYKGAVRISAKGRVTDIGLKYSGQLRTLRTFGLKPQKPTTKKQRLYQRVHMSDGTFRMIQPLKAYQLSFEVLKGRRRTLSSTSADHIFLSQVHNTYGYLPFRREKGSSKVQILKTLSVAQMIANEQVQDKIFELTDKNLSKRFEHHLEQAMK